MRSMDKETLMEKGFAKAARLGYSSYIEQDVIAKIYKDQMLRYSKRHGGLFNGEDAQRFIDRQFAAVNDLTTRYPVSKQFH